MDDYKILLGAILDAQAEGDIDGQLKAMKDLSVIVSKADLSDNAINDIKQKLSNSGISIDLVFGNLSNISKQASQTAQQIGDIVSNKLNNSLDKITSKEIGVEFKVEETNSDEFNRAVDEEIRKIQNANNKLTSVRYTTDTEQRHITDSFGNDTGEIEHIEKLTGAVFRYNTETGEAITKTMKWAQIGTTVDNKGNDIPLMGWVQGLTTYNKSLDIATAKTDNFLDKQKQAVASFEMNLQKIQSRISDQGVGKPIKDQDHIDDLNKQYNDANNAIQRLKTSTKDTFTDTKIEVQKAITELELLEKQYRNAENVAVQMKSVDISSGIKQAQERLGKLKSNAGAFEGMTSVVKELDDAFKNVGDKSSLDSFINNLRTAESQLSRVRSESRLLEKASKIELSTDLSKIETDYQKFGNSSQELENNLKSLNLAYDDVISSHKEAINSGDFTNLSTSVNNYNQILDETKSSWKELYNTQASLDARLKQSNRMKDWLNDNQKAASYCGDEIQRLIAECETCNKVRLNEIQREFEELTRSAKDAGKAGNTAFGDLLEHSKKFVQGFGLSRLFDEFIDHAREAIVEIKELDNILTEISKTSDLTGAPLQKLGLDAYDTASNYGKKASDYLFAVQSMSQSGFYGEQGEALAEQSLLAQAAGDLAQDVADGYIIATNAAYKLGGEAEKLNEIIDGQNSISNRNSVALRDMASAMSTVGTVASSYNVAVEDLSAMIGTIESVTKSGGDEVGNSIKSILVNLQSVTNSKIVNTLNKANASMTEFVNGAEKLRNPIAIIRDLAKTFNTLDEDDPLRAEILQNVAGKYQVNGYLYVQKCA